MASRYKLMLLSVSVRLTCFWTWHRLQLEALWDWKLPTKQQIPQTSYNYCCPASLSSVVFGSRAGFWQPFSKSPSLSVLSCPFECNKATIICQIIWILLLHLGLPFILPSVISCKFPLCLKTWPIHRRFLCQTEFSICLSSFTLLRTSS